MSTPTAIIVRQFNRSLKIHANKHLNWARNLSSTAALSNIKINVSPKEALLDNPPVISVEGLERNQNVTLWNTYTDDSGLLFSTHAHYIADENGVVDIQQHMSRGGRYKGLFPEGIVASLQTAPPVYEAKPKLKWARLYKKNVEAPMKYTLSVINGHVEEADLFSQKTAPKPMGETEFLRHLMGEGVTRVELETDKFKGVLFKPAKKEGPFPVVLDLFGAESGIKEFRSAMLASYGYAAFVLPYYQYKDLPPLTDRLDLEYFLNAIDHIDSMPGAAGGGIGVIGSSKGGELALALASLTEKIKACITINCYNKSVDVGFYYNQKEYSKRFLALGDSAVITGFNEKGHMTAYGTDFMYARESPGNIPVERIHDDCEVLVAAGDEDGGHAHKSALAVKEIMRHADKSNTNMVVYPGVGHLLDPPFHSHMEAIWNTVIQIRKPDGTQFSGIPHYYGGTPYAMVQGTKDLWRRTLALFHKKLVQQRGLPTDTAKLLPPY